MAEDLQYRCFAEGYQNTFRKLAASHFLHHEHESPGGAFAAGALGGTLGAGMHGRHFGNGMNEASRSFLMSRILGVPGMIAGGALGAGLGYRSAMPFLKEITPQIGKLVKYIPQEGMEEEMMIRKALLGVKTGLGGVLGAVGGQAVGRTVGGGLGAMQSAKEHNHTFQMPSALQKYSFIKRALNPWKAGAGAAPFIDKELAAIGERYFHNSFKSPGVMKGLVSTMMPSYRQLKNVHELLASGVPMEHPSVQEALTAIGATVKPREQFVNRAVAGGVGLGVGGLALGAYNRTKGQEEGQRSTADAMGGMPMMDRLRYLLAPQRFMSPVASPPSYAGQDGN